MKIRMCFLIVLLVLILTGMVICGFVFYRSVPELKGEDIEELRDSLKVYQTIPDVPETELPDENSEFPEEIPEITEEASAAETEAEAEPVAETEEPVIQEPETVTAETERPEETVPPETESPETEPVETQSAGVPEPTLDFAPMQEMNPDIYAWIDIEGTKVDYPVLQSTVGDKKYLTTAPDGSYYIGGSLFTEAAYNSKDFNDPVTVIYGHTMRSGTLFGQLQSVYSSADSFKEHSEIVLYLPDEVRYYTVFAAVPYENLHILHTYDFSVKYWYNSFFKSIRKIRSFGANFNQEIIPEYGDRVIILSTCLNEDSTKRFLVMAILQDDTAERANP